MKLSPSCAKVFPKPPLSRLWHLPSGSEDGSWCRIVFHNGFDLLFVGLAISFEEVIRISLCWRIGIWIVQQVLDTEENLLDSDGWLPTLFFIQDGKANSTGGIDVGVEKWGNKFAYVLVRYFTSGDLPVTYISEAL